MTDPAPKIAVYDDSNFGGESKEFTGDISDLTTAGFNDRTSSLKVFGSVWVGYADKDFKGRQYILEEGEYSDWKKWQGSNDQLSSLKMLNPDNLGLTPTSVLYEHDNFGGNSFAFEEEVWNLKHYKFNDEASSVKVKTGTWILYEDADFKGRQYILEEGNYDSPKAFANDKITSLRPVNEPAFTTEILSMTFDLVSGMLHNTPHALVNLSQSNNTSVEQTASWSTTKSVTTTKTFEWHWDNSTTIGASVTFKTGVPVIAKGELVMSVENTFNVGTSGSEENTQQDEWTFELPSKMAPNTRLTVQVVIQEGKMDVPFKAVVKRGSKVWEEQGTYNGVQSYNLVVDYTETPL